MWLEQSSVDIDKLRSIVESASGVSALQYCDRMESGVPTYDSDVLRKKISGEAVCREVQSELIQNWESGAGIAVFKNAFNEHQLLDHVTESFFAIIDEEKESGQSHGDHFAKPGANDRIWNALEKFCLKDPGLFVRYYSNDILALTARAWLGPGYQVTSQVNCVNPGGEAQTGHRDYHLGFMTASQAEGFPLHIHQVSPKLTLQCAIAHVDMPLETGPTLYLPHSQKYDLGYLLAESSEFQDYFSSNCTQLPLEKGDYVVFNPALLHAAGSNKSATTRRIANLLQISSPFGRAMESVNRSKMSQVLFPVLCDFLRNGVLSDDQAKHSIACTSEGYAFPTNLDRDPPLGGLAPPSQQDLVWKAIVEQWPSDRFDEEISEHDARRLT